MYVSAHWVHSRIAYQTYISMQMHTVLKGDIVPHPTLIVINYKSILLHHNRMLCYNTHANIAAKQGRINARASRGWSPGAYKGKGAHWLQGNYIFIIIIYMGICSSDNSIL